MNLQEFLRTLDQAQWTYFVSRPPHGDGTRIYAVGVGEIWEVDFLEDGTIEADIYRVADVTAEPITDPAVLKSAFGRMSRAWQEAANDLGIAFESPFYMTGTSGDSVSCAGHLPAFGGPLGSVIVSREDADEAFDLADAHGYHVSGLNPRYYERYDRARFIDTLSDWGWYGEGPPPSWYKADRAAQ